MLEPQRRDHGSVSRSELSLWLLHRTLSHNEWRVCFDKTRNTKKIHFTENCNGNRVNLCIWVNARLTWAIFYRCCHSLCTLHILCATRTCPAPNKFSHILYRNIVPHAHKVHKYKFRFYECSGLNWIQDCQLILQHFHQKKKENYFALERKCQGIWNV